MIWNDATKERPDNNRRVIVSLKNEYGKRWTTIAEYVGRYSVKAEDFLDPDCDPDFCDVDGDGIEWAPEGWYESPLQTDGSMMVYGVVEWWMEIPAIPGGDQ